MTLLLRLLAHNLIPVQKKFLLKDSTLHSLLCICFNFQLIFLFYLNTMSDQKILTIGKVMWLMMSDCRIIDYLFLTWEIFWWKKINKLVIFSYILKRMQITKLILVRQSERIKTQASTKHSSKIDKKKRKSFSLPLANEKQFYSFLLY